MENLILTNKTLHKPRDRVLWDGTNVLYIIKVGYSKYLPQ